MIIPRKMNNEQSKIVAAVIITEREFKIARGKFIAAVNFFEKNFDKLK